jgi:hypothetical protein
MAWFRSGPEKVLNPLQSQRTCRHQWRAPIPELLTMPLDFSDEEMTLLLELSRPIEPAQRSAFLDAVAAAIGEQASGPGLVHQVGRRVQRQFWTPPQLANATPVHRGHAA